MFEPIYGLQLISRDGHFVPDASVKGGDGGGGSLFPVSLGSGYADFFNKDKAPSQMELLGHLVGTAYRCVTLNSDLLATTRLRLYLKTRPGEATAKFVDGARRCGMERRVVAPVDQKVQRELRYVGAAGKSALLDAVASRHDIEEVLEHPLLDLLRKPEDSLDDGGLTSYDFRWVTQCLLETLGRAYWYVRSRDKEGNPNALLLLRSQLVREVVDTSGQRYIDHYEYGTNKIPPRDIIRFVVPDPSNPHLGFLPPMRAAIEKIRLARGGDAFTNALLENGGYPVGVFTPKGDSEGGGIGAAEARRVQSSIRSGFSMANAGRIMVLEHPGQLQSLAFKPAEIIDREKARELAGEIADCFGVPRTKIFRDSSNRASGQSGDEDHAKDAGLSRCTRFEETLNSQVVPLFDPSGRLFFAFDSPLPPQRAIELDETRTGGQLGINTINEGREALGLEPEPGPIGQARLIPERSVLVNPDGTPLSEWTVTPDDTMAINAAKPQPQPKPAAGGGNKPKKPKKSAERKILDRLTAAVELLAQRKDGNEQRAAGFIDRADPEAKDRKWPAHDVGDGTVDSRSERAAGKAGGIGALRIDPPAGAEREDVAAALKLAGYTDEEIEAMKPKPHVCEVGL